MIINIVSHNWVLRHYMLSKLSVLLKFTICQIRRSQTFSNNILQKLETVDKFNEFNIMLLLLLLLSIFVYIVDFFTHTVLQFQTGAQKVNLWKLAEKDFLQVGYPSCHTQVTALKVTKHWKIIQYNKSRSLSTIPWLIFLLHVCNQASEQTSSETLNRRSRAANFCFRFLCCNTKNKN